MKLVFEIAVDRQTRTRDQIFEGVPNPNAHIGSIFGPIMPNHLNMPKTEIMGALLVAIGLRNSYMHFHPD